MNYTHYGNAGIPFALVKEYKNYDEMVSSFKLGPGYLDVRYGEYVIISSDDLDHGGEIYRREYNFKNNMGGAKFITNMNQGQREWAEEAKKQAERAQEAANSAEEMMEIAYDLAETVINNELERIEAEQQRVEDFQEMEEIFTDLQGIQVSEEEPTSEKVGAWIKTGAATEIKLLDSTDIAQGLGDSEEKVLSQKAATGAFTNQINGKAYFSAEQFEVGNISTTGENEDFPVTIRSKGIMCFEQDIILQIEDGWRYLINYYDENDNFILQTKFVYTDEIIFAGTKFKLVIRKVADIASDTSFDLFVSAISYRYGNYIQNVKNKLLENGFEPLADLEHCYYTTEGVKTFGVFWVGTKNKLQYDRDIKVYLPDTYRYTVVLYNEDGTVKETFVTTTENTIVPKNTKFTVNVRLEPTSEIRVKEVYEALKISTWGYLKNDNNFDALGEFEYGYFENGVETESEWWGRTKNIHSYDRKVIISLKAGYYYFVTYYDENNNYLGMISSTTRDIVIPKNTRFRVAVRKHPTAKATLQEYKESIKVTSYILNEKPSYDWWNEIKGVGHAGCQSLAPQNTMAAYKKAVELGLKYIEADVRFTSDNVPVMIHNPTIDATSNGTGAIAEMTYAQALQYDFGSYHSAEFAGEKIPTLQQYCEFCRATGVKPYLELKSELTEEQALMIKEILMQTGVLEWTTFLVTTSRDMIWKVFDKPRMAQTMFDDMVSNVAETLRLLKSYSVNKNIIANFYTLESVDENLCNILVESGIPVMAGTSDSGADAIALPTCVTEFCGSVNFPEVLKENALA